MSVAAAAARNSAASLSQTTTRKRIVAVTGIGAVTPLGLTFVDSWKALLNQASGATSLEEALVQHQGLPDWLRDEELRLARELPCQVVAPVKDFALSSSSSTNVDFGKRSTARFIDFALAATHEAIQQSTGLADYITKANDEQRARIGVSMGSGMSAVREVAQAYNLVNPPRQSSLSDEESTPTRRQYRRLSPHFVPKVLTNSAAGRVSMLYGGMWGPNLAPSTACAAGAHALGHAWSAIVSGQADIMVAGGAEASVDPLSLAGFCQLRALATQYNHQPALASRPFDAQRNGFVLAEGAAVLILEDWQHAQERGFQGPPLAILSGYGASGDGFHVTAPDPAGRGAIRAMRGALQSTGGSIIEPSMVQYVNAHATSTPKGDEIEAQAIAECFGAGRSIGNDSDCSPLWVSSTKGSTGHLLGAAGALEAAFTVQALVDQVLPPTLNLETLNSKDVDDGGAIDFVRHVRQLEASTLHTALSNSFGFGGTNASLLFQSPDMVEAFDTNR